MISLPAETVHTGIYRRVPWLSSRTQLSLRQFTHHSKPHTVCCCGCPAGSIGTQTLDIIAEHSDRFELVALAAGGNVQLLAQQVRQFQPALVAVRDAGTRRRPAARSCLHCFNALGEGTPLGEGRAKPRRSDTNPPCVNLRSLSAGKLAEFRELIRDVPRQPEVLVGDEGAVEVARHPDIDAVVTGIVGVRPCSVCSTANAVHSKCC